jgi:hypothetical protein
MIQKNGVVDDGTSKSIFQLSREENNNVEKHLELLGDTYDLVTVVENLYDSLPNHCRLPLDITTNDPAHAAGINGWLMPVCRRELTTGTLTLLRGYRIDFLFHLRKAIEFCAFAGRMAKHPHMSRTWIQAGSSEAAWKKFREKFTNLFPADDKELNFLSYSYDEASEAMHGSLKAVAHYFSSERVIDAVPNIGVFDIPSDAVFIGNFIRSIDCHLTILTVFNRILKPYTGNVTNWEKSHDEAKVAFSAKHTQWMPLVKTAIIEPTSE